MSIDGDRGYKNEKAERGYSHSEKHSIVYTWEINEITSFIKSARSIKELVSTVSPQFSTGSKIKDFWCLKLQILKDESSETKSWITLYLGSNNTNHKVRAKYLLYILNNKKEKLLKDLKVYNQSLDQWSDNRLFENVSAWGYKEFAKIDELLEKKDEFLENDTLTVCVNLTVYDDYVAINNSTNLLNYPKRKLGDDFEDLFVCKKKCDVTIKVGDQNFDAHKLILFARSSVFEAMFSHDMKENKENKVNIPDINPETFKKVLDYIYTDKVDELDRFAEELLEASDKYQLHGLKELCEHSLSKTLTLDNAIRVMILADRHNAKRLKELTNDYVANNLIKLKNTAEYKSLEEIQSSLLFTIFKKYIDKSSN